MIADRLLTASLALTLAASANAQTHVYVDDDAPSGGNGLSWQSAFNDLHDAIELAKSLGQNRGEIRIAGGIYNAGSEPFEVPLTVPGVQPMRVMGGFAGLAFTPNPNTRDTDRYSTFLDADDNTSIVVLTSAVVLSPGAVARPAFHAPQSATTLDGLRFRNSSTVALYNTDRFLTTRIIDCRFVGIHTRSASATLFTDLDLRIERSLFASNKPKYYRAGGAIQLNGGYSMISACDFISNETGSRPGGAISIVGGNHGLSDCYFIKNATDNVGGAVDVRDAHVNIYRCDFLENRANGDGSGGALSIKAGGIPTPVTITNSTFDQNAAYYGGAILIQEPMSPEDAVSISNCDFTRNNAVRDGGAIRSLATENIVEIRLSDFADNRARSGGALYGPMKVIQSAFSGNAATSEGGAVYGNSKSTINHCELVNNSAGSNGGAIAAVSAVTLANFTGNIAGNLGGAAYNVNRFVSVVAQSNTANNGAGAYLIKEIHDSNISNNTGGGVEGVIQIIDNSQINQNTGGPGVRLTSQPSQPLNLFLSNAEINENEFQGVLVNTGNLSSAMTIEDSTIGGNGDAGIDISPTGVQSQISLDMARTRVVGNARHAIYSLAGINSFNDSMTIVESLLQSTNFPAIGVSRVTDLYLVGVTADSSGPIGTIVANGTSSMLLESSIVDHTGTGQSISLSESNLVIVQSLITGGMNAISQTPGSTIKLIGKLFDFDPRFVSPEGPDSDPLTWQDNDYRLSGGSEAIDAGAKLNILSGRELDLDRLPRSKNDPGMPDDAYGFSDFIDLGAYEFQGNTCAPDVNNDGSVDQRDFTAWIAAYNAMSRRADQNFDGSVTPSDYVAWIAAYFVGCP